MVPEQFNMEKELTIKTEKIFPDGYADTFRTLVEKEGGEMFDIMKNLPHYIEKVRRSGPDSDILISALLKDIEKIKASAVILAGKIDEVQLVLIEKDPGKIKVPPETEELKAMKKKAEEIAQETVHLPESEKR